MGDDGSVCLSSATALPDQFGEWYSHVVLLPSRDMRQTIGICVASGPPTGMPPARFRPENAPRERRSDARFACYHVESTSYDDRLNRQTSGIRPVGERQREVIRRYAFNVH